jgi:hypothetical protein
MKVTVGNNKKPAWGSKKKHRPRNKSGAVAIGFRLSLRLRVALDPVAGAIDQLPVINELVSLDTQDPRLWDRLRYIIDVRGYRFLYLLPRYVYDNHRTYDVPNEDDEEGGELHVSRFLS